MTDREAREMESAKLIHAFSEREVDLWELAYFITISIRRDRELSAGVRCHEAARIVGQLLDLPVQDGFLQRPPIDGIQVMDHSWLWTEPFPDEIRRVSTPEEGEEAIRLLRAWKGNILDPWVMGGFPWTQLVSCLPGAGQLLWRYVPGPTRGDSDLDLVKRLVELLRPSVEEHKAQLASRT